MMNLLYITRKYPPTIGGMEKVHFELVQELKKHISVSLIALKKAQKYLPLFLIRAFFASITISAERRIDAIYLGDALLSPLGVALKFLLRKKVIITVHGLDITYKNSLYQKIIPWCLNKLDTVICISEATKHECVSRGIAAEKCTVIHWGVHQDEFKTDVSKADIEQLIGKTLEENTKVLITVGRLVPRKGVLWFIQNVMPQLSKEYLYLVVGNGPDEKKITAAIHELGLENNVLLLHRISNDKLKKLYSYANLFIMPNIKIPGDMEGFGMVLIEAASAGTFAIAANLEGIIDAVIPEKTGVLIETKDTPKFVQAIERGPTQTRQQISDAVAENFSWEKTGKEYLTIIHNS